ncbi:MAG: 4a-hydroxytetrahydrobiopterin dehydratase [Anaerolineales bacterium]|nr:4a-hydroxytetrahydrobiopterin dehydratase [Anaerolineales bacterium]
MNELASREILPYSKTDLPLLEDQILSYLEKLPGWNIVDRENIPRLEKSFSFDNFRSAVDFTNRVAELAEEADHHPAILVSWGKATVSWWTHVFKRLHENDFIMAARTEKLFQDLI